MTTTATPNGHDTTPERVLFVAFALREKPGRMFQRCWSAILSGCMRRRATPKLPE